MLRVPDSLRVISLGVMLILTAPLARTAEQPAPAAPASTATRPPIREFGIETVAKLGRAIALHDYLAWVATDVIVAHLGGMEKLAEEGGVGWVIDTSTERPLVHFLRQPGDDSTLAIAYTIRFTRGEKPAIVPKGEFSLTPSLAAQHRARSTATDEFARRNLPICNDAGRYNFVTLADPAGDGFLVYLLRPKRTMETIPVGGHYRITVSADGKSVTQIDALSASCLTLQRSAPEAKGKIAGLSMSHLISPTPVETHVFLSLQERLPFYVITPDGQIWSIVEGAIERTKSDEPAAQERGAAETKAR